MNNYEDKYASGSILSKMLRKFESKFSKAAFTGDYGDLANKPDLTAYATQVSQDEQDALIDKAWKDGNLISFDIIGTTTTANYCTILDNGRIRISSDESTTQNALVVRNSKFIPCKAGDKLTLLIDVENNEMERVTASTKVAMVYSSTNFSGLPSSTASSISPSTTGVKVRETITALVDNPKYIITKLVLSNFKGSVDIGISLYKGEYDGPYIQYDNDSPASAKNRIAALETLVNVVSFNRNGGTGTQSPVAALSGQSTTIPQCSYTRTGYTFTAWNTVLDGTGTSYSPGDLITPTEDMTLYAQWEPVSS